MIQGSPNLDDRDFEDLMDEAKAWIRRKCPEWSDLSPSDPGIVMLEVFSHLTEVMLYRLNRLPEKAYVAFLNFLGAQMRAPAAARVVLHFERTNADAFLEIPQGTRVQSTIAENGGQPPVFATTRRVVLEPGSTSVDVEARAGEWVEGELLGTGSGLPDQTFTVATPPIVTPLPNTEDLIVAIEADADRKERTISWNGKPFEIWTEVESFANLLPDQRVYTVDRLSGMIRFAPAVAGLDSDHPDRFMPLAALPANGREIRAWYRCNGGSNTNVPAGALTVMRDAIPGLTVTNPAPSTGGVDGESLENALLRAPQLFRTLNRAVTAGDFEILAQQGSAAVGRAKAFTQAEIWAHAEPGTVEVLLVPSVPDDDRRDQGLSSELLESLQTGTALDAVQQYLDARKVIGSKCQVKWTRYKTVRVCARVVVQQVEDTSAVHARLQSRLNRKITALPNGQSPGGWPYGAPLHVSSIYDSLLSEPGVVFVDRVRLEVEDAPDTEVHDLEADAFQKDTWYAGEDEKLFRSTNNGEGWEIIRRFNSGEKIIRVKLHPGRPGMIAVISEIAADDRREWLIHCTSDCGDTWDLVGRMQFQVRDCAWIREGGGQHLLLATDQGLYKLKAGPGAVPIPVVVDSGKPTMKLWNIETAVSEEGMRIVAIAAQDQGGVYLSMAGTQDGAFRSMGLQQDDVRVLSIQQQGPNFYLWAGAYTFGASEGNGCSRLLIGRTMPEAPNWQRFADGWRGGSCMGIACTGTRVFAATHHAGVVELNLSQRDTAWKEPGIDCGLALRDVGRFHQVHAVAAMANGDAFTMMAGGPVGVFRRKPDEMAYDNVSKAAFDNRVTLPATWLFCPGEHKIEVLRQYEV